MLFSLRPFFLFIVAPGAPVNMSVELRTRYSSIGIRLLFAIADNGGSNYLRMHFTKCIVDRTSGTPNMTFCETKSGMYSYRNQFPFQTFYSLQPKQEYYFSVFAESRAGQSGSTTEFFYVAPELQSKYLNFLYDR